MTNQEIAELKELLSSPKKIVIVPHKGPDGDAMGSTLALKLLLERQDKSVIAAVKTLFNESEDPRFRLHALYVLEGMNALDAEIVKKAMKDSSPGVRENAAILSERFPGCLSQLTGMVNDSSVRVAFQAALSLGEFKDKSAIAALSEVIEKRGESKWFTTAVLSSESGSSLDLLKELVKRGSFFDGAAPGKKAFLENFSNVIGGRNQKNEIVAFLEILSGPALSKAGDYQAACVSGLIRGQERAEGSDDALKGKLKTIATESRNNLDKALQDLKQLYK